MPTQADVRRIALALPETEPHHDGYPAVLVRLPEIGLDLLQVVLAGAWRCRAPKRLVRDMGRVRQAPEIRASRPRLRTRA